MDGVAPMIFHVTTARDWADAQAAGEYRRSTRGKSFDEVGFIHCSHAHQIDRIRDIVYGDATEPLVVLAIDPDRLHAPVVDESLDGIGELFPHIYGPVPLDAVVDVRPA